MTQTLQPPAEPSAGPLDRVIAGHGSAAMADSVARNESGEFFLDSRGAGGLAMGTLAIAALPTWKMAELAESSDFGVTTAVVFGGAAWHLWRFVPPHREVDRIRVAAAWVVLGLVAWQLPWIGPGDYWFVRTAIALGGLALVGLWGGLLPGRRAAAAVVLWAVWLHLAEPLERAVGGSWICVSTANVAGWFLWQAGQDVAVSGALMRTPAGLVEVGWPCTGVPFASLLLILLAIGGLLLRLRGMAMLRLALAVSALAFAIAVVRVAVLALIVGDRERFDYWHSPAGAGWFSAAGMLALAWMIQRATKSDTRTPARDSAVRTPPRSLQHVVWPIGATALAAFCVDAGNSPTSSEVISTPVLSEATVVRQERKHFALPARPYSRFAWQQDESYELANGGGRLHVMLAMTPVTLGGDPRGLPDAPEWTRARRDWALRRMADGSDVWVQAGETWRGWVAALGSDGSAVLHPTQWREYYLQGFAQPRRWLEWLKHEQALCDKQAYFLALRWEGSQAGEPVAEAGMAAAYSAWRMQIRTRGDH